MIVFTVCEHKYKNICPLNYRSAGASEQEKSMNTVEHKILQLLEIIQLFDILQLFKILKCLRFYSCSRSYNYSGLQTKRSRKTAFDCIRNIMRILIQKQSLKKVKVV